MSTVQTILVADDSLTIRKLVEAVLCEEGYQVTTATTGAECLQQAAAKKPDLILLDYILPDMQGTEICRSLINSPETWEIPILMMSSNGNAIRQLYQDLNNVADYLTKPFAPSVLKAVVGHLLQKEKPVETTAVPSETPAAPATVAAPAAPAEPAMPKEFMDKVSRLLGLMENQAAPAEPVSPSTGTTPADATAGTQKVQAAPRAKAKRTRKAVAAAPASDALQRKFRLVLQKHLRARMHLISGWESSRGAQEPEDYFLKRLLSRDVLSDLSADLARSTGAPSEESGALRCPVSLLPLDSVLRHLHATHATGELRIETAEETVLACLEQGEIVLLTSNHPRNYCAGAACNFQAVPHLVISQAVAAQEEQSVPFFISLKDADQLPVQPSLEELLRSQGESCLVRAFKSPHSVVSFSPLTRLSPLARMYKPDFSLNQLLLVCYRTVNDWFAVETVIPDMDATLIHSLEMTTHARGVSLNGDEAQMLAAVRPGRTIPELAETLRQKPFEICLILFRLIKLGLIRTGPRRTNDARVDEDIEPSLPAEPSQPAAAEALPVAEIPQGNTQQTEAVAPAPNAATESEPTAPPQLDPPVTAVNEPVPVLAATPTSDTTTISTEANGETSDPQPPVHSLVASSADQTTNQN